MTEVAQNPLEVVLLLCASAAPKPWYPRLDARFTDTDRQAISDVLEMLWLEKLVERAAEESPESGPGFVLTALGARVLRDRELLGRLREGQPVDPNDRGAAVRASLRSRGRPLVTRLLLLANVAVFLYGLSLCWQKAPVRWVYLTGFPGGGNVAQQFNAVEHQLGAVQARDLVEGDWWRLLACCFVHAGLLHLGMNMYMLYALGGFVERTWGRLRYAVMYLLAGWGGSCVAMAYGPVTSVKVGEKTQLAEVTLVGASGALCGIFAAEVIWILLNGKHLPQALARRARRQTVLNIILIVVISVIPGVSGLAHLGGAIFGAVAALLIQIDRFGRGPLRRLALAALVPLPLIGVGLVQRQRAVGAGWQVVEKQALAHAVAREKIAKGQKAADDAYRSLRGEVLSTNPARRKPNDVQKALATLTRLQEEIQGLIARVEALGPYRSGGAEELRQNLLAELRADLERYQKAEQRLRAEEAGRMGAEDKEFETTYLPRIQALTRAADRSYRTAAGPLMKHAAAARKADTVAKAVEDLKERRRELVLLAEDLNSAGPYVSQEAEQARKAGREYAEAQAALLELAIRGLEEGVRWTKKDTRALEKQEAAVAERRKQWRALLTR
jgi:membrane associated rhomboid family serine protease